MEHSNQTELTKGSQLLIKLIKDIIAVEREFYHGRKLAHRERQKRIRDIVDRHFEQSATRG